MRAQRLVVHHASGHGPARPWWASPFFGLEDEGDGRNDARGAHARPIVAQNHASWPCGQMLPRRRDRAGTGRWRSLTSPAAIWLPAAAAARLQSVRPIRRKFAVQSAPDYPLLLNAAQMDGVHGGESAQEGCARPGSPPAPIRAPGGDRTRRFLHRDRLRHCIGRQVERNALMRAAVRRHASVCDHDRWYARPARSSPMSRALDDGDSLERR